MKSDKVITTSYACWLDTKEEYITTTIGLRALAEKRGVSATALAKRCRKEEWVKLRNIYRERVSEGILASAEAHDIQNGASQLKSLKEYADRIKMIVAQKLHSFSEDSAVSTQEIRSLTATLKDLCAVVRNLYDLPTIQEREAMSIARERLTLEQKKYEDKTPTSLIVTFQGEAAKWAE